MSFIFKIYSNSYLPTMTMMMSKDKKRHNPVVSLQPKKKKKRSFISQILTHTNTPINALQTFVDKTEETKRHLIKTETQFPNNWKKKHEFKYCWSPLTPFCQLALCASYLDFSNIHFITKHWPIRGRLKLTLHWEKGRGGQPLQPLKLLHNFVCEAAKY